MECMNCGAETRADNGTCVACGAVQDLDGRSDLVGYGSAHTFQAVAVQADPSDQPDVPALASPARTRVPWRIVAIVTATLIMVATIAGLAVSRSSVAATLETTRAALGTSNDQLGSMRTQLDGLQTQLVGAQSQLDDANVAKRDVQESLTACQDLFRMVARYGNRAPSGPDQAKVASLLISCFQGELPPSLFP